MPEPDGDVTVVVNARWKFTALDESSLKVSGGRLAGVCHDVLTSGYNMLGSCHLEMKKNWESVEELGKCFEKVGRGTGTYVLAGVSTVFINCNV